MSWTAATPHDHLGKRRRGGGREGRVGRWRWWGAEALLEAIDRGSYASGRSGRTYELLGGQAFPAIDWMYFLFYSYVNCSLLQQHTPEIHLPRNFRIFSVSLPFLLVLLFYYTLLSSGWLLMKTDGLWLADSVIGFICFLFFPLPFTC